MISLTVNETVVVKIVRADGNGPVRYYELTRLANGELCAQIIAIIR